MSFDEFVSKGWADHADDAAGVMERLPQGLELAAKEAHVGALSGLIVHVAGEHLGRFGDGDALLAQLLDRQLCGAGTPAERAAWRGRAILARCAGDADAEGRHAARALAGLSPEQAASGRIRILATAASALLGQRRTADAARDFRQALELAAYGPSKEDPAATALAMMGNNLACELEVRQHREPEESTLMLEAAAAGREYWEIAGDWMNVERAEYRLSAAHLAAGNGAKALEHAHACVRICRDNEAPPFELFFAHERLALACHAQGDTAAATAARNEARGYAEAIDDPGDKEYCLGELGKLESTLG